MEGDRRTGPETFTLCRSYPNPFNSATVLEFSLPEAAEVSVAVYDLRGRQVARVHEGWMPAGLQRLRWDAKDCPSGSYLCRVRAGKIAKSTKLVLLR